MTQRRQVLAAGMGAAALPGGVPLALAPSTAAAPALPHRAHTVRAPDGLSIAADEHGNPNGPAILFIHGCMQAALS
jgi:Spy/CpxP family protein refolding chaperone